MSRPPKYHTNEERAEARKRLDKEKYQRVREKKLADGWIPRVRLREEERSNHRKANCRRWYLKNRDRLRSLGLKPKQPSDKVKHISSLKRRYGITSSDYAKMLISQSGCCDCCGRQFIGAKYKRGPHVDHDHKTGKVRSLLCHHCNVAVGWVEGNSERLSQAFQYVERHSSS